MKEAYIAYFAQALQKDLTNITFKKNIYMVFI